MDAELKQYLDAMKEDLKDLKGQTKLLVGLIGAAEERLKAYTRQECEKVETTLLTEFHKWASPTELRIRSHATAMRALDLEIEDVKDRLTKLEPPSPAS